MPVTAYNERRHIRLVSNAAFAHAPVSSAVCNKLQTKIARAKKLSIVSATGIQRIIFPRELTGQFCNRIVDEPLDIFAPPSYWYDTGSHHGWKI